jgi:PTS system nitrogen regulatory IIA component
MKLKDILTLDCIKCAVPLASKKRILEELSIVAAKKYTEITEHDLLNSLMRREKMGSTGIGNGIAIPHGKLSNVNHPIAVFITTEQAIPFDAIDNRPVDIFIALFVPEDACDEHLSTLQDIARLFSNNNLLKQIRKAETAQQLYQLITNESN